jgi:hypothetical protein
MRNQKGPGKQSAEPYRVLENVKLKQEKRRVTDKIMHHLKMNVTSLSTTDG